MMFEEVFPKVVALVADVLGTSKEAISKSSNFFMLGGNSMQALELCLKIEQAFPDLFGEDGIDLSLIATEPDFEHFVEALISTHSLVRMNEGEL